MEIYITILGIITFMAIIMIVPAIGCARMCLWADKKSKKHSENFYSFSDYITIWMTAICGMFIISLTVSLPWPNIAWWKTYIMAVISLVICLRLGKLIVAMERRV